MVDAGQKALIEPKFSYLLTNITASIRKKRVLTPAQASNAAQTTSK
jgi:hypothetical protein